MLWQKSPQYQNMPHDEYMKTAEGQQSQQAFQNWHQWTQQNTQQAKSSQPQAPPQVTNWMQSQAGQFFGGGPTMPPDVRQAYGQWYSSANKGTYSGSNAFAPGGTPGSAFQPGQAQPKQNPWATSTPYGQQPQAGSGSQPFQAGGTWGSGPVPGTQMYRPAINQSPYGQPAGTSSSPSQRQASSRQRARGGDAPAATAPGYYSPMPAGTPQGLAPFFDQARQMDPNANPFQQRELAYQFRNMQQAQEQQRRQAVTDQANASWMNDQAQAAGRQFARNPASGAATQGRSGEYIEKKRRQKLQQDARNNAQLGDPNWARTQEKKNVVRKEKVRRRAADTAARERDAEVTSRRGQTKEEFMARLRRSGVNPMDAQKAAVQAGYYFPDPMDKYF